MQTTIYALFICLGTAGAATYDVCQQDAGAVFATLAACEHQRDLEMPGLKQNLATGKIGDMICMQRGVSTWVPAR